MQDARPLVIGSALTDSAFRIIARACFLSAAGTSLAAAAIVAVSTPTLTSAGRLALVASLVLYAALADWACGRSARRSFEAAPSARGGVRLAVVDSGVGIEPDLLRLLFQPFSQGDASTTRRFGGTGLGLSICRQLGELMGGTVGVESRAGQGSTFWADLPLAPAVLPGELLASEASDGERLKHARVLLVEDNPVNMMIAAATLAQWGIEVTEARDGHLAIEAVHEAAWRGRPFDLVLMDVQMPVMSGHEATIELRKGWSPRALPIIALTAAALVSERELALAAGMNDFLTKPIDAPKLRRTLARHVRKESGTEAVDAG
jgi:CheY-like chemotaxis protein